MCIHHNMQEIVVLYFGHFMDYENSLTFFFLCQEGPEMLPAMFSENRCNSLGGV